MPSSPKPRRGSLQVEATSLVSHLDRHLSVSLDDANGCPVGVRVLGGVAERLLHEPVDRALDLRLEAARAPTRLDIQVDLGRHGHAVRLERTLEEAPQCRLEPDVVECRRSQLGDQPLELGDLGLELPDRLFGRLPQRFGALLVEGGREDHLQRAKSLERFVMKFSGPAAALLVGGRDAHPQLLLLDGLRGGQSRRGAAGEGAHQPLVLGAERRGGVEAVERDEDANTATVEGERHEHRHAGAVRQVPEAEPHAAGHLGQPLGVACAQDLSESGFGKP